MKLVLPTFPSKCRVYGGYAVFLTVGLFLFGWPGLFGGIVCAYLSDYLSPRYMQGIDLPSFQTGLTNFLKYGVTGSRMCILLPSRRFFLYRGVFMNETMYAFQFNRTEWRGVLGEKEEAHILSQWGSAIMPERRWRLRDYAYIILDPNKGALAELAFSLTQYVLEHANVRFENVLLHVDVAHVNMCTLFSKQSADPECDISNN